MNKLYDIVKKHFKFYLTFLLGFRKKTCKQYLLYQK